MGLKTIGDTAIQPHHRATCHCGAVALLLDLPDGVIDPKRCNCSYCRRRGTIVGSVPLAGLHVVKGADQLRTYEFHTRTARHYFCGVCGIHTHHQRRSNPEYYAYNLGCLEGVDPLVLRDVPTSHGAQHPSDRSTG